MKNSLEGNRRRTREIVKRKQMIINGYKNGMGCKICGEDDPVVLEFHHRDRATKNTSLVTKEGKLQFSRLSFDNLFTEIEKCDVLCANCHRRVEHNERKR
jgi:hypothetical protein